MTEIAGRPKGWCRVMALVFVMGVWSLGIAALDAVACEAHNAASGSSGLHISQAWSPTAPPAAGVHAGYFTIANDATTSHTIVGATSPLYEQIDIHRTTLTNGIASMQAVDAMPIAPGEQVQFAPGGLHLMLMSAKDKRTAGDRFPITLHFQNGDTLTFEMTVKTLDMSHRDAAPVTNHSVHKTHSHHGH